MAVPANPLAMITSVKSLAQAEQFIRGLRKSADAEALGHLQAIHQHVLSLLSDVDLDDDPDDVDEDADEDDDDGELAQIIAELKHLAEKAEALATA